MQESIAQHFCHLLRQRTETLRQGVDTGKFDIDVGSMTTQRQIEAVKLAVDDALEKGAKIADKARATIRDRLTHLSGIFSKQKYMLGAEFSMLDVALAPLLWRLDHYGIVLPKSAAPLMKYANRVFSHQGFIDALTPAEKLMRR